MMPSKSKDDDDRGVDKSKEAEEIHRPAPIFLILTVARNCEKKLDLRG